MRHNKHTGIIKRSLAGFLVVGMVLTGMPALNAEAANEFPGQTSPGREINTPENPPDDSVEEPGDIKPGDDDAGDETDEPGDGISEPGDIKPGDDAAGDGTDEPGDGISEPGDIKPGDDAAGDGANEPVETKPGDETDGSETTDTPGDVQETETPQPGAEDEETGSEEEEPAEDGDDLNAVYNTQVSGNDISGNDLIVYEPEEDEGRRVVGGYIELPEDRDVSVVDESARIYDYEGEIAPLMSDSLPSQYIPESGTLPLTRSQNPYGSCWAHSAMALAETDMMRNEDAPSDADYSELHLAYFSYNGPVDDPLGGLEGDANYCAGNTFMDQGGNLVLAQYVLANWVGAADESAAPYSRAADALANGLSKEIAFTDVAHLQNAFQINLQENPDIAKRMIQKYGGVGTSYRDADQFYNSTNKSYYCDTASQTNHAVTIVGWDDSFSVDNFNTKPEGDGAWLIRNSWLAGADTDSRGRNTYFWMSYYDKSLASGYAFDFEDADNYHHNYQYDGSMASSTWSASASSVYTANVFTARAYEGGERLEAVGMAFAKAQTPYTVTIYKNLEDSTNPESGELIEEATTSGTCACEGFYTIPLRTPVNLAEGDTFSVVVRYDTPENETGKVYWLSERSADSWFRCEAAAQAGQSFYKLNSTWVDFGAKNNCNLRIKAYTMDDDGGTGLPTKIELKEELKEGIAVGAGDSYQASCTVLPRSATDRTVRWESDQHSVATVDEKGLITGVSDGTATITVTCVADSSVEASFLVEVYSDLRSIRITGAARVTAGETMTLQTVRSPSSVDAADVQWSSSDERVLAVDADGAVTGTAPGYATITAGIGEVTDTKQITCEFPSFSYSVKTSMEGITLTWPGGPGVQTYQIYRVEGTSWTNPELLAAITPDDRDTYSYLDENVAGNSKYIYEVRAAVNYIKGNGIEEKTISSGRYIATMPQYYPITYHLNGGENNSANQTSYRAGYSYNYIRDPMQRTGYNFTGWYYDEGLTQKLEGRYLPSDLAGSLDLYAGWTPIVYRITYRLNGGTNAADQIISYTIETATFTLREPTREGYIFEGWYTDSLFTNPIVEIAKGNTGDKTLYAKWAEQVLENGALTMQAESFTYTGMEQRPQVALMLKNELLVEGRDYTVVYHNNKNVGMATAVAKGIGDYHGSISCSFMITPAALTIRALDKTILVGEKIPGPKEYEYESDGLLMDDRLITEPLFSCGVTETGTQKAGRFTITPFDADAGPNYAITYANGWLTVKSEYLVHRVTFDMRGHGVAPETLYDVKAGSTIDMPEKPEKDSEQEGYVFKGWCKDAACTQDWDFDADIVQSDITLYAKWAKKSTQTDNQFGLQEIEDIYYYTGKAWKPVVNVYDGETMLKAGRDYTVKYFNNINANAGGVWKKGNGQGADFNPDIPYVQIVGKGNYADEIKVNFDIHPAAIADETGTPAEKVVLKYTNQFVAANKELTPFGSVKYGRVMKRNQDYTLTLTAEDVRDDSGETVPKNTAFANAAIPKEYEGRFTLTVAGIGNYSGMIKKTVYVTDQNHLMKNAKITLGKNQKNIELTGGSAELTASTENSADTFTVKLGGTVLTPEEDYEISYLDGSNRRVGKATLVITGVGEYAGTKTAAFTVKGKAFTAGKVTVTGMEDKVYTGRAITQNNVVLVYNAGKPDEEQLKYGDDYTVSYAKNINKGTATMTFTGSKGHGFSGSFKKTFKIAADEITEENLAAGWDTIVAEYSKAGAKPVTEIVLTNAGGKPLQNGKDYVLSYKNNKLVASAADEKAPTIIVKGKGNYQGTISIPFTITGADLRSKIDSGEITVETTAVAYQAKKSGDYVYKPAVRLMEGKTPLRPGADYTVTYVHNTQAEYNAYIAGRGKAGVSVFAPQAVIETGSDSTYLISGEPDAAISVPLTIYRNKLTKANLRVEVKESECVYMGIQVTPEVVVYYRGENGETVLAEDTDYTVSYGANVKSGKKAGSLTVSGRGTRYGGDVTVKFEILRKKIEY